MDILWIAIVLRKIGYMMSSYHIFCLYCALFLFICKCIICNNVLSNKTWGVFLMADILISIGKDTNLDFWRHQPSSATSVSASSSNKIWCDNIGNDNSRTTEVHRVATIWCDNISNGNSRTTEVHRAATIWCDNIGNGNGRTTMVHRAAQQYDATTRTRMIHLVGFAFLEKYRVIGEWNTTTLKDSYVSLTQIQTEALKSIT